MAQAKKVMQQPAAKKRNPSQDLRQILSAAPATSVEVKRALRIEKRVERDGIEMGVLSDGTAYLSSRGIARLCGVHHSVIGELLSDWENAPEKRRMKKIKNILTSQGLTYRSPVIDVLEIDQTITYAWPDVVCLAILEYYAFDAQQGDREQARQNYRTLAGKALHDLIYTEVGYDPRHQIPEHWRIFHDRVSLTYNSVPAGFFCIFKEIADMVVHLGQNGVHIDATFVPDISVGLLWGRHWTDNKLDLIYGIRIKSDHNYPKYFPQAKSNPQQIWSYPEEALGEFRRWLREQYIGQGKFTTYLKTAVKKKELPASFVQLAIAAYSIEGTP